mmetsp:Transcript_9200/g.18578  ORF Transcript_9200/g.18578 Transcript_9200/m.18578 type:complete len:85 (+) Transcript_9200:139-393(+)
MARRQEARPSDASDGESWPSHMSVDDSSSRELPRALIFSHGPSAAIRREAAADAWAPYAGREIVLDTTETVTMQACIQVSLFGC